MLSFTNALKPSVVIHYEDSHKTATFGEAFEEREVIHLMFYEAKPGRQAHYGLKQSKAPSTRIRFHRSFVSFLQRFQPSTRQR